MNIDAIKTVGETVANEVKLFRSAAVTSENRATPFARSILAALVAGTGTKSLVESMVIHAFGNPKTPKGKAIDKLSGSGDYLPGWGATRKTVAAIFDVFDNIDADAPRTVGEGEEAAIIGEGKVRETVVAFILSNADAPKSLRALREAVKAHVAAFAAQMSPDNKEAADESESERQQEAGEGNGQAATMSLVDRANALLVAYQAASAEDRLAAQDALTALFLAVDADTKASGEGESEGEEAAAPALEAAE